MDFLDVIKCIILGCIEGLTEFLPISSTAHLILVSRLINYDLSSSLLIFSQLGAVLAMIFYFKRDISRIFLGIICLQKIYYIFVINLIIAFLPSVFFGLLLYRFLDVILHSELLMAINLIIGGVIILLVEYLIAKNRLLVFVTDVFEIRMSYALYIGLSQALAIFPGVSRSGATIITSMFLGFRRDLAVYFSFLLGMGTIFAATVYDGYRRYHEIIDDNIYHMLVGFFTSFFISLLVVRCFISFVKVKSLKIFGYYRCCLGIVMLLLCFIFAN